MSAEELTTKYIIAMEKTLSSMQQIKDAVKDTKPPGW